MLTADATGMIGGLEEATSRLERFSAKAEKLATPPAATGGAGGAGGAGGVAGMSIGGAAAFGLSWGGALMSGVKGAITGAMANLKQLMEEPFDFLIQKLKMIPLLGDILAAPVEAAKGIFGIYKEGANTVLDLAKKSEMLGLSTVSLQAILAMGGGDADMMAKSLFKFSSHLGEISGGSDEARHKFERFGLKAKDMAAGGVEVGLVAIMDRMKELSNPTERAALAFAAFDKTGYQWMSTLSKGSGALEELKEKVRMAGGEFSAFDVQQVKEAEVKMRQLEMTIKGAKMQVATGLAPVFAALGQELPKLGTDVSGLTDGVFAFAQASGMSVGLFIDILRQVGDTWEWVKVGAKLAGAGAVMMAHDAIDALNQLFDEGLRKAAGFMEQLAPEGSRLRAVLGKAGVDVGGMVESMRAKADEHKNNPLDTMAQEWGESAKGAMDQLQQSIAARGPGAMAAIETWFNGLAVKIAEGRNKMAEAAGSGLLDERLDKLARKLNEQKSPLEEFRQQMNDLDKLSKLGILDPGKAEIAAGEALMKLEQANKVAEPKGVAALAEGSAAAMSAIAQFNRADSKDDAQQRMLDAMNEAKLQREEIIRNGREAADGWRRMQVRGI